jgi:hypothetical protein
MQFFAYCLYIFCVKMLTCHKYNVNFKAGEVLNFTLQVLKIVTLVLKSLKFT